MSEKLSYSTSGRLEHHNDSARQIPSGTGLGKEPEQQAIDSACYILPALQRVTDSRLRRGDGTIRRRQTSDVPILCQLRQLHKPRDLDQPRETPSICTFQCETRTTPHRTSTFSGYVAFHRCSSTKSTIRFSAQ